MPSSASPFSGRSAATVFEAQNEPIPAVVEEVPFLSRPRKVGGAANWNYYPLIAYSRQLGERALERLRTRPSLLWEKAVHNYTRGFALYGGRNPYEGTLDRRSTDTPLRYYWARLHEIIRFQYFGDDTRVNPYGGFHVLFPLLLMLSFWQLWRRRSEGVPEIATITLVLLTIPFVTAVILFTVGIEGNRLRFSTEPYLYLLAAWLFPSQVRQNGP